MTDQPFGVFDLESKLAEDTDGSFLRAQQDELAEATLEVKRHLDSGLPPEEFQQAEAYAAALEKASVVLGKVAKSEAKA